MTKRGQADSIHTEDLKKRLERKKAVKGNLEAKSKQKKPPPERKRLRLKE